MGAGEDKIRETREDRKCWVSGGVRRSETGIDQVKSVGRGGRISVIAATREEKKEGLNNKAKKE